MNVTVSVADFAACSGLPPTCETDLSMTAIDLLKLCAHVDNHSFELLLVLPLHMAVRSLVMQPSRTFGVPVVRSVRLSYPAHTRLSQLMRSVCTTLCLNDRHLSLASLRFRPNAAEEKRLAAAGVSMRLGFGDEGTDDNGDDDEDAEDAALDPAVRLRRLILRAERAERERLARLPGFELLTAEEIETLVRRRVDAELARERDR